LNINNARGVLFEEIVKMLLKKNDYEDFNADGEQVDSKGRVRGRGEWHQIDALGRWSFTIPFVYPIRLLCEAKCLDKPVGLPVVRNFVGVLKDVLENYFVEDHQDINKMMLSKRYTDCGAIFSVSGFTNEAQRYAYAQNIFLVSYENNPIIDEFKKSVEGITQSIELRKINKGELLMWFKEALTGNYQRNLSKYVIDKENLESNLKKLRNSLDNISTSVVGIASGVYPIHLLSRNKIPKDFFIRTDDAYFRVTYYRTELGGHYFEIFPSDMPQTKFYFTIPEVILSKYRDSMKRFKLEFLEWIDVPVKLDHIRRILRFKLDKEWLRDLELRKS